LLIHFALETARLAMLPTCEADIDEIGRIANEPGVRRYLFDDQPIAPEFIRAALAQSVSNLKRTDSESGPCGRRSIRPSAFVD
jgi:hypothetical protein